MTIPDKKRLLAITIWGTIATFGFALPYGICNSLALKSPKHYAMFLDFETQIPLIPWMIYPYVSLNLLFVFAAFVLEEVEDIKGLCLSLVVAAFSAGIVFYLFPGKLGFVRQSVPGYEKYFETMFALDHPHNLFPSLHITYSSITFWIMNRSKPKRWFKFINHLWLFLISCSVVLVHQHHLFDILTGFILAILVYRFYFLKYFINKANS